MPHAGTLELTLINDDKNTHCAVLPCNGDYKFIWLVNHSKGTATLELDGPGYYWYGSRTGNDEGRGLTAAIDPDRKVLDALERIVPLSGKRIADVGTGIGHYPILLARRTGRTKIPEWKSSLRRYSR